MSRSSDDLLATIVDIARAGATCVPRQPDLFPDELECAYADMAALHPYEPLVDFTDDYKAIEDALDAELGEDDNAYAMDVCVKRWGPI